MNKPYINKEQERMELLKIQEWFPQAKLKADYNREILDIGVEIVIGNIKFILLKGDQTNHSYELITPECRCIEGLETLASVFDMCTKLIEENVDYSHELTSENSRKE